MSHTSSVTDVNYIPLMTKIENSIRSGAAEIIKIINYRIDFKEVEEVVKNICKRLDVVALVFPVYSKRRIVAIHLIPI